MNDGPPYKASRRSSAPSSSFWMIPNSSPANVDAGVLYRDNREQYNAKAKATVEASKADIPADFEMPKTLTEAPPVKFADDDDFWNEQEDDDDFGASESSGEMDEDEEDGEDQEFESEAEEQEEEEEL